MQPAERMVAVLQEADIGGVHGQKGVSVPLERHSTLSCLNKGEQEDECNNRSKAVPMTPPYSVTYDLRPSLLAIDPPFLTPA